MLNEITALVEKSCWWAIKGCFLTGTTRMEGRKTFLRQPLLCNLLPFEHLNRNILQQKRNFFFKYMFCYFEFELLNQLMKRPYGRCWEAGSTQGHVSLLECIQLEFLNFICISYFNNQGISNSTSSIQEYTEK